MREKLSSLAITLLGFMGLAYYLITYQGFRAENVIPAFGIAFAIWFVFWFAWAFRWVVVIAPTTIAYIMFAFYGAARSAVGIGIVVSGVLFVLTGIQQWRINRKTRAADKQAKKQYDRLKKRFDE